jgi:hypothetical protein
MKAARRGGDKNPTMSETYESISDVELTNEHIEFLRDAGASEMLIAVLRFNHTAIGINRNSARSEVQKYVYWGALDDDCDPAAFSHLGGHFFSALWEGDLFGAWTRADSSNKTILREMYGEHRIVGSAVEQGKEASYARRMV